MTSKSIGARWSPPQRPPAPPPNPPNRENACGEPTAKRWSPPQPHPPRPANACGGPAAKRSLPPQGPPQPSPQPPNRENACGEPAAKRWSPPQPPPHPLNPANACGEPAAKRGRAERTCSLCKMSKSLHDGFSKNQRGKGADAKCRECILGQHQGESQQCSLCKISQRLSGFSKGERGKGADAKCKECIQGQHQDEKQQCSLCKMSKSLSGFSKGQRGKGAEAKCKECIQGEQKKLHEKRKAKEEARREEQRQRDLKRKLEEEERQLAARLREEEERRRLIAENQENEACHYDQMKAQYDRHIQRMKNAGKDIAKEMSATSNLVYVVTSISKRGAGALAKPKLFSPHLHGIFASCEEAREYARGVFETVSMSYRNRAFVHDEERVAKCDSTEFLAPGIDFDSRVLFEVFRRPTGGCSWGIPKHIYEFTAVAINALPIDADDCLHRLPFLERAVGHSPYDDEEGDMSNDDEEPLANGSVVFALFTHTPEHDEEDVNLCGVFRNRKDAERRGLQERKDILAEQKEGSPKVNNGIHFYKMLHENCCAVRIESVALGQGTDAGKKLEFGTKEGGCIWTDPSIEWY